MVDTPSDPDITSLRSAEDDGGARERLLEAATDLFARKGYASTSVREIVDAAGVTKPTLYYYFRSKEGIYQALMQQALDEFEAELDGLIQSGGSPWQRVRRLCSDLLDMTRRRLQLVRLMYALYYGPPQGTPEFDFDIFHRRFEETVRELLGEAAESGQVRPGQEREMALAVVGLTSIVIDITVSHPERELGQAGLERMLDLLHDGIRKPRRNKTGKP